MTDSWEEIAEALRSSDPDQVNEAIDRIKEMDADERALLFDRGFDEITTIYADSTDGYVRQSTVRATKPLTPGMVAGFLVNDDDQPEDDTAERLRRRVDTIRVRSSR